MKKSSIKKICAAFIIIIVFVILFAFILPKPASEPPIPTFNFLSGQTLTAQIKQSHLLLVLAKHYLYIRSKLTSMIL
ncbi:MAG: hypothetical protein JXA96_10700 [Sedimentisphaerales bacterium]|nr:hypothetical protein [Sedimentisphaerales bacterium]